MKQTLFEAIKAAGIEYDYYQSDLFFRVTDESSDILKRYPQYYAGAGMFYSKGSAWYDVPFAYDPFWEKLKRSEYVGRRSEKIF